MTVIDISAPVTPSSVSWEDRFPVGVEWHSQTARGDRTTNSTWRLHAHTGTHLDAPLHHIAGGGTIADVRLEVGIGPVRVLDLTHVTGSVTAADLADVAPGERLLLKTRNSIRGLLADSRFTGDFVALSADAAELLVERGTLLVGADYLSVECYGAGTSAHHALLGAGVAVLEGVVLDHVEPGRYTLLFLPLSMPEAEAAPGRAVLLPIDALTTASESTITSERADG